MKAQAPSICFTLSKAAEETVSAHADNQKNMMASEVGWTPQGQVCLLVQLLNFLYPKFTVAYKRNISLPPPADGRKSLREGSDWSPYSQTNLQVMWSCFVTDATDITSDFIVDQVVRFPYGPRDEQNKAQLRKTK